MAKAKKPAPAPKKKAPPAADAPRTGDNIMRENARKWAQGVAVKGTKTQGTQIGQNREIVGSTIGPAREVNPSVVNMGPTATMPGAQIDTIQQNQFRERQMDLANALQAQMRGEGPSLAALQLRQATDANIAGQMSAAANAQSANPALAMRTAAQNIGTLNQQAANQAAQLRFAEALEAQRTLAGLTATGREADINVANQQAGFNQQAQFANMGAQNEQAFRQAGLAADIAKANQGAVNENQTQQAALNQQANLSNQAAFNQANIAQGQISGGVQQAGIGASGQVRAAGAMAGAQMYGADKDYQANLDNLGSAAAKEEGNAGEGVTSDKRMKKKIKPGDRAVREFLDALEAATFEYKNKKDGAGRRMGVMAQDAERSEMGDKIVKDTKGGKKIDVSAGLSAVLAAQATLNKRLERLEARHG